MREEKLREIPFKNYFILGIVILVSLLIIYYFYMWIDAYNDSKLNRPILDKYMEVINYNELEDYLIENPDTIIYVSVLEDSKIRDFEKKFKSSFRNNKIEKKVLYLELTEELKKKEIKKEISSKYMMNGKNITNVPSIMVIENGNVKSILNIRDNNYDIDNVEYFINSVIFLDEDEING